MIKTAVFLVCSGIGYLLGHYLPVGAWSAYVSILVSYHLFLGWLVFTAEHKAGFSLPVFSTILTHSAFLAILIGLAFGRESVPLFGLIRIFIPGLASFESTWLFGGGRKSKEVPPEPIAIQPDASAADAPVADAQFNVEVTTRGSAISPSHIARSENPATFRPGRVRTMECRAHPGTGRGFSKEESRLRNA